MNSKIRGFTLVELAIVMVIIAIIIAGILKGRDVLTNMKMNAIITNLKEYTNAYDQFKEKYMFAPGDYPDAEGTWAGTTNGDADGVIDEASNEQTNAWNQLSRSEILNKFYAGSRFSNFDVNDVGTVVPSAPFAGGGYSMYQYILQDAGKNYGNVDSIVLGKILSNTEYANGLLTAPQAFFIDTKLDDNNPLGGKVWAWFGGDSGFSFENCINGTDDQDYTNDAYAVSQETPACYVIYLLADPYINN